MNRTRKQKLAHTQISFFVRAHLMGHGTLLLIIKKKNYKGDSPPYPRTPNGSWETFIIEKKCRRDKGAMLGSGALDNENHIA